jgi:hypothetical protein
MGGVGDCHGGIGWVGMLLFRPAARKVLVAVFAFNLVVHAEGLAIKLETISELTSGFSLDSSFVQLNRSLGLF